MSIFIKLLLLFLAAISNLRLRLFLDLDNKVALLLFGRWIASVPVRRDEEFRDPAVKIVFPIPVFFHLSFLHLHVLLLLLAHACLEKGEFGARFSHLLLLVHLLGHIRVVVEREGLVDVARDH